MFEHVISILKTRFRVFEKFSTGVYRCFPPVVTSETKLGARKCLHRWSLVVFSGVPVRVFSESSQGASSQFSLLLWDVETHEYGSQSRTLELLEH